MTNDQPIPEPGQLYRSRTFPDILWIVMSVDPSDVFQIKARRCDAEDQTHIGRWSFECFAEYFERVEVVGPPPNARSGLRVGRKVGRTIYNANDQLIGVMDTPELAAMVVAAVNGVGR